MKWLIGVAFLLITLVSCVLEMREIKRRETAEKLFEEACELLKQSSNNKALEKLRFMRWNLAGPKWFDNFLDTNNVVTRERYREKLHTSRPLSEQELSDGMDHIQRVSEIRENKRRETAEKLFEEACELLKQNRNDEALERLQFIRWGLVCPKWFNTFLDTNKIVTRERYMKKLQDSKLLSEEELLHGMNRLEKVARLIGKTNW